MPVSRRQFLAGVSSLAAVSTCLATGSAHSGTLSANSQGLRAGSPEDQGRKLQKLLEKASRERKPVFVEPGRYRISNLTLPEFTDLRGMGGLVEFVYGGGDHFIFGENAKDVRISGIAFDADLLPTADYADAALHLNRIEQLSLEDCEIINAAGSGMHVTGSSGVIEGNRISGIVGPAGFIGHDNTGLQITDNVIEECANGGILVHRWDRGTDNTIVSRNRVRRISAIYGGTGQWGNGINTYLADGVTIADNQVSDCAFSTIRCNSGSNLQISNNTCLRAGETSVYAEFAFDGAVITGNIIDGGATGISMANFNEGGRLGVCSNNLIRNMRNRIPYEADGHIHGNGIYAEADTTLVGNVIEAVENYGIMLGWGPYLRNVTATSNMVRKAHGGFYVSVVDGIGDVVIADNILADIGGLRIAGYAWHERRTADLVSGTGGRFPTLQIRGNTVDS